MNGHINPQPLNFSGAKNGTTPIAGIVASPDHAGSTALEIPEEQGNPFKIDLTALTPTNV